MQKNNRHLILIALSVLALASITFGADSQEVSFEDFYKTLEVGTDEQAVQTGQKIFERIGRKYRTDAEFGVLKSKMMSADFLANQMITQLKKATTRQMLAVSEELFKSKTKGDDRDVLSVKPAISFYLTSRQIFSKQVSIGQLEDEEKKFIASFYNLKLRILSSTIAKAGQALAIAEPSFEGTYDYVLVLPLLHTSENRPVNINVLPKWMCNSSQLNILSDSCLLHYGFTYHAQVFARAAAQMDKKEFLQEKFYRSASKKCAKQKLSRIAADCLKKAIDSTDPEKTDEKIAMQLDIVQTWLNSDNFTLAAGEAKNIIDNFPDHEKSGNAAWLHFYALSRANNAKAILANINASIANPRCSDYMAKLMYLKWWALRREKNQSAQIAALEHKLITDYGKNAMVAPIMLSRATDLLAKQDYSGAFAQLDQLQEKFPDTKAAQQAKKIMEKLKVMQGTK